MTAAPLILKNVDPDGHGIEGVGAEILERLLEYVETGTTFLTDEVMRVPLDHYRSQERHELELDTLFRHGTQMAAPSASIPNAGDFTVRDVLDKSLLISRDADGVAHVLLNYCTHRGAMVAEGEGCTKRHTCPYHAWAFDPSGALVGIPGAEGFEGMDRTTSGLFELPSVEAHGFIWYTLDPEGEADPASHLGPMAAELDRWGFGDFWKVTVMDLEFPANWKSTMEAFSETYHFPFVHGDSIGGGVVGNTTTFDLFGPHHRLGVPLVTLKEVMAGNAEYDANFNLSILYWVCPDMMMACGPFGVEMIQITPTLEPCVSRLRHTFMAKAAPSNDAEREIAEAFSSPAADAIRIEDGPVLSLAGRGLREGAHSAATIGRNEPGVQNIHNQVNARLS